MDRTDIETAFLPMLEGLVVDAKREAFDYVIEQLQISVELRESLVKVMLTTEHIDYDKYNAVTGEIKALKSMQAWLEGRRDEL